jgi:hypothetical protein
MKDIMKTVFDAIFSINALIAFIILGFGYAVGAVLINDNKEQALVKATTKLCYDNGLVKVDTDAGFYCVAPANLVKVEAK